MPLCWISLALLSVNNHYIDTTTGIDDDAATAAPCWSIDTDEAIALLLDRLDVNSILVLQVKLRSWLST